MFAPHLQIGLVLVPHDRTDLIFLTVFYGHSDFVAEFPLALVQGRDVTTRILLPSEF